jgi:4-oxalocrotonate tautomerase
MPIVTIELIEGRTVDQKREMAKKITDVIKEVAKVKEETVEIIFHDMKKENFAKAGKLAMDI